MLSQCCHSAVSPDATPAGLRYGVDVRAIDGGAEAGDGEWCPFEAAGGGFDPEPAFDCRPASILSQQEMAAHQLYWHFLSADNLQLRFPEHDIVLQ